MISNSPSDLQPVLDAVAQNAARICEAKIVDIVIIDNNTLHIDASFGDTAYPRSSDRIRLDRSTVMGRSICDMQPVQMADMQNADDEFALGRKFAVEHGYRTILGVPLIREGRALGTILVRRTEVRPLRANAHRTSDDVCRSGSHRHREHAAAEGTAQSRWSSRRPRRRCCSVISSSPGELEPVFQAMLENAVRICEAKFGNLFQYDNEMFDPVGLFGVPPTHAEFLRQRGRIPTACQEPYSDRLLADQSMRCTLPTCRCWRTDPAATRREFGDARIAVGVPMLKDNAVIGAISIYRQEVSALHR